MNELFKKAIQDGASDIHIKAGDYVRAHLHGKAASNSSSDFDLKMNILGGPGSGHAGGVLGGDPSGAGVLGS